MSRRVHLDYESRSRIDLKQVGAFRYSVDLSTEIFMAAVSADDPNAPVYLWINPKFQTPDELGENEQAEELLRSADQIVSHNAPFEMAVTWGTHERRAASPFRQPPPVEAWRCSAAVARKAGLPSSLEKLGEALNLPVQKDNKGKALIRFFSIPNKEGKFNEPRDHPEKWKQFCEYCRTDVRVEKMGDNKLKAFELQGDALATFQFDLRMNLRGIPVNLTALRNAKKIIDTVESQVTTEFQKLTGLNPTQREAVRQLVGLEDMQADTVEAAIDLLRITLSSAETAASTIQGTSPGAEKNLQITLEKNRFNLRVLELYSKLSYAAIKKVETMLDWACPDSRLRGVFKYYGAGTGRWAAGGPQLHNAKKATKEMRPITKHAYAAICKGVSAEYVELSFGEPYEVLASTIRHFVHEQGAEMLDGDYNAIEARIIDWRAGQHDILQMWRDGADLYRFMASEVYGVHPSKIDDDGRSFGKVLKLACGFGMGPGKYLATCEAWGVKCDAELAERGVATYRRLHREVQKYWYRLDDQARQAIGAPGVKCGPFLVRNIAGMPYLLFQLPSGRSLAYPHPKIEVQPNDPRDQITYWGQMPMSQQWGRIKLYGGKLAENEAQAIAADIMAHGAICAEKAGMPPFALIHDQGLSLRENGRTAEDYARALGTLPTWAKGLPLKVEAKQVCFYSK